ncbi:MAG: GNAT family N-acetyltransferase [Candidatus Aegiribacteria sp.]|nr:GNAT family N-acetyltransferase [Candidatus Aegiribacteria sp.]
MYPEIRIASITDIPGIMDIENLSFPCPWDMETITACIESPSFRTWTSRLDGQVAGYITAQLDASGLHILNLAADEDKRRLGQATCLLRTAESWGRRLGAAVSYLEVRENTLPAQILYTKNNYNRTRLIENYYPDGEDGVEFRKTIQPDRITSVIAEKIFTRCAMIPPVGVVLGSGLSWLAKEFGSELEINYEELLGESSPAVPGHPGKISFSSCGRFVFMLGRRHHYQGYVGDEISVLPGVLGDLGVTAWILTSSSGAVDTDLHPGDAVLFRDHVNFAGCVPDSTCGRVRRSVYSERLREAARKAARRTGTPLREGVFACVSGPAYETSAEIKFLKSNCFSTVSMSTVPEALLLSARGFDVAALSLVTNAASPEAVVTHDEVLSSQGKVRKKQEAFLASFLREVASVELQ